MGFKADSRKNAQAHFKTGNGFFAQKEYLNAIGSYKSAVSFDPDYFEAYCNMGVSYKNLNQLKLAKDCYLEAIKIKPNNSVILNNIGNIYVVMNKFEEALDYFNRALQIDPYYTSAIENLVEIYSVLGKYEKAIEMNIRLETLK